jgi:osmotically-inducible protein OsmY
VISLVSFLLESLFMMKPLDARVRDDVIAELAWDAGLDARGITVAADHGSITFTGYVSSYAHKIAAAEAAHRVAGVLDVVNELEVRLPDSSHRSDPEIAGAVRKVLEWDVTVPHEAITTTVSDGVIIVEGVLPTAEQRVASLRAIRNLVGVKGVVDHLRIQDERFQVTQVEQAIRSAFLRHAHRDAAHVSVDVVGDTATLSGNVHSWAERQVVLGAARGTRGVRRVIDRLRIDPQYGQYEH